jgi:ABC-2 type transport system permease protein/sodium transport system permease protein
MRLARKELRETLRDRRTILTLVLMPLFVYPLLGLTFQKFLLTQAKLHGNTGQSEYILGFASEAEAVRFRPLLAAADTLRSLSPEQGGPSSATLDENPLGSPEFKAVWPDTPAVEVAELVKSGAVDVGIEAVTEGTRRQRIAVKLIYNPSSVTAVNAKREIEDRLRAYNESWFTARLRALGSSGRPPVTISATRLEMEGATATTIASVLPFVLLLMTATGAVYPAIDLTAGERERGTLEALVAAPVSRPAVLVAKYVAVFTVAVLTAGMNLIAMTITAYSLGIDRILFADGGFHLSAISPVVALVLVLAAFFSAVLLLVTSFARSFKEAQAYLIPVMLVSLAPGIVSMMPDLTLTLPLAVTPLIGIVLLARDLLTGQASSVMILACVASTLLYAAVALLLAARAFGTDAVLYGSEGTWTDLIRRPSEPQAAPPVSMATACLAAVFPAFLLLGPLPSRWESIGFSGQIVLNALLTVFLFFLFPTVAAIASRADFTSTFRLGAPPALGLIGALLLGLSLWTFAYELQILALSKVRVDALKELFAPVQARLNAVPLGLKLAALAVVPAACEEWFFRGFLLSSLRTKLAAWQAVLITGVLFGAFHVVVRDGLFLERLIPTTFLGLILGAICVRTGSLWPGMALHSLHNGLLLTLAAYEKQLTALGWDGGERSHLPWTWLAVAAGVAIAGAVLVGLSCRRRESV